MTAGSSLRSTDALTLHRGGSIFYGAVAAGVAGLVAAAWFAGLLASGAVPAMPPAFVAVDLAASLVVAWCAVALGRTGHTRVGWWVLGVALSLAAYLVVVASAFTAAEAGSPSAPWFVACEGGWYIVPLTVAGVASLVAVEELTARRGGSRILRVALGALAVVGFVTGLGIVDIDPPYPGLRAPLAGTWWDTPVLAVVFGVAAGVWMLSAAVPAIVAWRVARRSEGLVRARVTIVAIAASAPPFTIASCLLLGAADGMGAVDGAVGTIFLAVAFCLSTVLVGWGIRIGVTARDDGVTGAAVDSVRRVLGGLWVLTGAQLAITVAAVLGTQGRGVQSYAVGAVAVALVVSFIAAFVPVARRLGAFVAVAAPQPVETPSSTLSGTLSPREREVLALLAEGRSNAAIAGALFLSERTVDSHVSSIFDKLGLGRDADANRRVQAAAAWLRASVEPR